MLLAHPGGPYWKSRDLGAWTLPKGEIDEGEDPYDAARREFVEETGFALGEPAVALAPLKQPSGKLIHAWAIEGDCDPAAARSIAFRMEWPPKSGNEVEFPEIDRVAWFTIPEAERRILPGQAPFLAQLQSVMARGK